MFHKLQEKADTIVGQTLTVHTVRSISKESTLLAKGYEAHANVQGIGPIATSWIGINGVRNIADKLAESQESEKVKKLTQDLKRLANSCQIAFNAAGLLGSTIPEIQSAVKLCKEHGSEQGSTSNSSTKHKSQKGSQIAQLWRKTSETVSPTLDPEKRAQEILGTHLTDSVLEGSREPPHVSVYTYLVNSLYYIDNNLQIYIGKSRKTAVLHDRDVNKELAEGMNVAIKADNFLRVCVVKSIHQGTITVQ